MPKLRVSACVMDGNKMLMLRSAVGRCDEQVSCTPQEEAVLSLVRQWFGIMYNVRTVQEILYKGDSTVFQISVWSGVMPESER
ncbi:hypothetical protein Mapa_015984 [Marchantia paleacea]|nr:hypothetical protein Mapa_015984 [Marchantia paleacea]